jgi:PAS domain S-box-containing protein
LDEDYVSGVQPGDPESLSEMDVPLIIDGKVCGLIGIESTRLDAFTLQDQTLVEILAQHVSSAISRLIQLSELEQLVKERTKNLSLSEEKLTNFMESATDAFNLYDSELNLVANNQAAMSLFPPGIIREDVLGKNMLELVPGLEETGRYDEYKRVIETGISIQIDELFLHPSLGDIHLSVKAFKVGDGLGIIGTNITERKQMEENLRNAERLAAAGRIASMVGHDLRGPLQTIKNALYLMEHTPKDGAKLRKTMDEAVDYAANMLEELRLNVGDSPLQLQEVNLGALIERAVLEASITDSVETGLYIADGLDSVHVDPLQIRRVLDNLVRNAVEAMPDGGTLKVSAEVNAEGMELTVRDTGTGIPIDLMPDLFKAFVTTKSKGMGLGLAYCKRAVEAHGGTIVVESKEGVGTTFTVKLPRGPT